VVSADAGNIDGLQSSAIRVGASLIFNAAGLQTGIGLLVIAAVALFAARRINRPTPVCAKPQCVSRWSARHARSRAMSRAAPTNWASSGAPSTIWRRGCRALLESQRQLLRDVSHEQKKTRSPLAALRIGIRAGARIAAGEHFARIEQERTVSTS